MSSLWYRNVQNWRLIQILWICLKRSFQKTKTRRKAGFWWLIEYFHNPCYYRYAMTRQLPADQRDRQAEKIMEWGNLVFLGLVVTQILSDAIDVPAALVGVVAFAGAYFIAEQIMKGGGKK